MPDTESTKELDALAFEIFCKRMAAGNIKRGVEQEAIESYRKADAFLAVRKRMRSGGDAKSKAAEGVELADVCAPNLPRHHPINLVAKKYVDRKHGNAEHAGDLTKVNRIHAWLQSNPTPESDPEELVARINHQFSELNWTQAEVNTARIIFPAYCGKN